MTLIVLCEWVKACQRTSTLQLLLFLPVDPDDNHNPDLHPCTQSEAASVVKLTSQSRQDQKPHMLHKQIPTNQGLMFDGH